MSGNDPPISEVASFFILVALGCGCYILATLVARWVFPRHVYLSRFLFLSFLLLLALALYLPSKAVAFSGDEDRWYRNLMNTRGMGTVYGMSTILIWPILALLQFPRKTHHENTA